MGGCRNKVEGKKRGRKRWLLEARDEALSTHSVPHDAALLPRPQLSRDKERDPPSPPLHVSWARGPCLGRHTAFPAAHLPKWEGACEGRRVTSASASWSPQRQPSTWKLVHAEAAHTETHTRNVKFCQDGCSPCWRNHMLDDAPHRSGGGPREPGKPRLRDGSSPRIGREYAVDLALLFSSFTKSPAMLQSRRSSLSIRPSRRANNPTRNRLTQRCAAKKMISTAKPRLSPSTKSSPGHGKNTKPGAPFSPQGPDSLPA